MFPSAPSFARLTDPFRLVQTGYRRAQEGLFHGRMKQYGNNVPFSKKKTRRTWQPNVQPKHLWSHILERKISMKVTTRALRTMKKYGSLDNYLLNTPSNLLGEYGVRLRIRLLENLRAKDLEAAGPGKTDKIRYQALEEHLTGLRHIRTSRIPTLADAKSDRVKAGEALGLAGPAKYALILSSISQLISF
ncbi:50S ribosomal protein L24 [Flagelloscypha sp. PMI_526]|nr:50S ribosomal protein L24 [Flagelloscypha sp. PMI_526]